MLIGDHLLPKTGLTMRACLPNTVQWLSQPFHLPPAKKQVLPHRHGTQNAGKVRFAKRNLPAIARSGSSLGRIRSSLYALV